MRLILDSINENVADSRPAPFFMADQKKLDGWLFAVAGGGCDVALAVKGLQ